MIHQFNEIQEHKNNNLIKAHPYDVGYDVRAGEGGIIPPGTASGWIHTGLHVCFPIWLSGDMLPRSGQLSQNVMVAGTIDPTYHGAIGIKIFNHHKSNNYSFKAGDRIAQMKISIAPEGFFEALANGLVACGALDFGIIESEDMDEWGESQRGVNGFGSSGVK